MKVIRAAFLFVSLVLVSFIFIACQPKMKPEEDCNFVMSSHVQRVSWKNDLPVIMYIHASVPSEYKESLRLAAAQWNYKLGKTFFSIQDGLESLPAESSKDGLNVIYWKNSWEPSRSSEQARTTIHWRGDKIIEADINVNAKNNVFAAFGEIAPGKVDFVSLMVHELGHVLGLQHIQGEESVMNPTLAQNIQRSEPTQTDLNSLKCEYKL
jgi:hypothetical protein